METNVKNVFYFISAAIFLAILCVVFKSSETKKSDELVVGMMSGWAPFMTINQNGDFIGFDVDVAQEVANKLKKELVVKDFGSLGTLLVALQQNKINFAMSGLDITSVRLQKMDMVPYTGLDVKSFYLLFWNKIPKQIRTVQDLKDIKDSVVCAEPGSPQSKYLEGLGFVTIKAMAKLEDMVLDIKYGKSLAMIVEPQVAKRLILKNPELISLEIPLPVDFQVFGMGIAFAKNNILAVNVKNIIEKMRTDKTLKTLENKWELEIGG